jgi:Tol biopolymer transport system component
MKNITLFILMVVFGSCQNEEKAPEDKSQADARLRAPFVHGYTGDHKVTLTYFSDFIPDILLPYKLVDPDYFEIYESEGKPDNFRKFIELKNGKVYTYSINYLKNNTAYYFYVVGKKEGYTPLHSDTIMVMPNEKLTFSTYVTLNNDQSMALVSYSPVANRIAYVNKNYTWNGGENCCMAPSILLSTLQNKDPELLAIASYDPDWSSDGAKIIFAKETMGEGYNAKIVVYDVMSEVITVLADDTAYMYHPVFSPSDGRILYQSSKDRPDNNSTNIWLLDLNTLKTELIIDLAGINLVDAAKPDWINENDFLFQGTGSDNRTSIYRSSVLTKETEPLIRSNWNDYNAAISPDGEQVAFISDRSGTEQLWLFNIQSKEYKQLTGYDENDYFSGNWTRINWMNNYQLLFTFGENRLTRLLLL